MSRWTLVTLRGRRNSEYARTTEENSYRGDAANDIAATMDIDTRIREWTAGRTHIYGYLDCLRGNFSIGETILDEYSVAIDGAVIVTANDTTGTGHARYYPDPADDPTRYTDEHKETEEGFTGEEACAVISARNCIMARDPFHTQVGWGNEMFAEFGTPLDLEGE